MSRRILVTGAAGFIGAVLTRHALEAGHTVHIVVRPDGDLWRLREIRSDLYRHDGVIEDAEFVDRLVTEVRPDWVFNLAAYGGSAHQQRMPEMIRTNVKGVINLLGACVRQGFDAFVHAGSSSEYGYKTGRVSEKQAVDPKSDYAVTKVAASSFCQDVARTDDVNAIVLRFYSVYGPYEEPSRFIPTLLVHGLENRYPPLVAAETARDFVYVDDAVRAALMCAAADNLPRGATYNVCTGVQTRIRDAVAAAGELLRVDDSPVWRSMEARPWDTPDWVGDPEAIRRDVNWQAQTGFQAGLKLTVEWLQADAARLQFYKARVNRAARASA